jgi:hypothetical protein
MDVPTLDPDRRWHTMGNPIRDAVIKAARLRIKADSNRGVDTPEPIRRIALGGELTSQEIADARKAIAAAG